MRRYLGTLLLFTVLLLAWEYATTNGYLKPYRFPAPSKIARSLFELMTVGFPKDLTIWVHTKTTIIRILQGYVAALVLAIPLGFLIGAAPSLEKLTNPLIVFGRSIATLSLLPLVIVWFGTGELTKVVLIGYGCFWTMISNVIAGVKYVDRTLIAAARTPRRQGPSSSTGPSSCRQLCRACSRGRACRWVSASWSSSARR